MVNKQKLCSIALVSIIMFLMPIIAGVVQFVYIANFGV
jgi:hypothetical protein